MKFPLSSGEINRYRGEYGRQDLPFGTVIGLARRPGVDTFQRLEEHGMTAVVSYPFKFALGDRSSIDDTKRVMERFAATIIRHCQ